MTKRLVLLVPLAMLAIGSAGCSEVRGEDGLTPTEEACINGNSGHLEERKECEDLKPQERSETLKVAHDKQVEAEEHEAETVIKKRHAEELANSAEGR